MSRKPNATKQYCDAAPTAAAAIDDDKETRMKTIECVRACVCVFICACVFLCLCSNLFSYVLQCVQWILYTLPHRCSLLHHSFIFWFEYNTSVHCVKTYRRRRLEQWRDRFFFYNWLVLNWCQRCSSLRAGRRSSPPSMLLLFSSSLVGQTKTLEWNWHEPYGALLLFSFLFNSFTHSFIPLDASTERRGEKETALSERTVIENVFVIFVPGGYDESMAERERERERERRTHLPAVLQLS